MGVRALQDGSWKAERGSGAEKSHGGGRAEGGRMGRTSQTPGEPGPRTQPNVRVSNPAAGCRLSCLQQASSPPLHRWSLWRPREVLGWGCSPPGLSPLPVGGKAASCFFLFFLPGPYAPLPVVSVDISPGASSLGQGGSIPGCKFSQVRTEQSSELPDPMPSF